MVLNQEGLLGNLKQIQYVVLSIDPIQLSLEMPFRIWTHCSAKSRGFTWYPETDTVCSREIVQV